jgi:hypothetical protein
MPNPIQPIYTFVFSKHKPDALNFIKGYLYE